MDLADDGDGAWFPDIKLDISGLAATAKSNTRRSVPELDGVALSVNK